MTLHHFHRRMRETSSMCPVSVRRMARADTGLAI